MKTFEEFIEERAMGTDANKPFVGKFNGIDLYLSSHAQDREYERLYDKDESFLQTCWDKLTSWVATNPTKIGQIGEDEGLIKIKSLNQAFIVSYRRSLDNPSIKKKNLYIVTILPPGRDNPKPGTLKFVMEHVTMIFEID